MGSLNTGGGSSAVASSAHAGCERYRHTDPLVSGTSRRKIALQLGKPDTSAGIPEARWMRAMTFERLVRHDRFVSQLLTTAVGALDLSRPSAVRRAEGHVSVASTQAALVKAHAAAISDDCATMITGLAVPFVGMEAQQDATAVKPDFAIVAPRVSTDAALQERPTAAASGSWLIMGDAKDYERVRSRIDDQRMLKGFLQVALGAESASTWSVLPEGMELHRWGVLAVPRNAFLQPEAVVEMLDDHRREVRSRVDERVELLAEIGGAPLAEEAIEPFVRHLEATFDSATCPSCALHNYCRDELRSSNDPGALLTEIGIKAELRPALRPVLDGEPPGRGAAASLVANVRATLNGLPESTGQKRTDQAGTPGSINVVLAKSDSAALGLHGIGIQRISRSGSPLSWRFHVFDDPQSPETRAAAMELIGRQISASMDDLAKLANQACVVVHIVVPDSVTGDVLVSMADSMAGVETSRLRWARDVEVGRPPLTFDGEPAVLPSPLTEMQRLAVSFLLEDDRARAMQLRCPLLDLRSVMARHVVAGGPLADSGRLDYLVEWAEARQPLDHRVVSDLIADHLHTPGARLSNTRSDAIHSARREAMKSPGAKRKAAFSGYRTLVKEELAYKADVLDRALNHLWSIEDSRLREVHRVLESDAQKIWRRRLDLHASDLVRFGRTSWVWRNSHVELLDADATCFAQLSALGNPLVAKDLALDASNRYVASAEVVSVAPLKLRVASRRLTDGSAVVAIHINDVPCVESAATTMKVQGGSFKFGRLSLGPLLREGATDEDASLLWRPAVEPNLRVGDELIVADVSWFGDALRSGHEINVARPKQDTQSAPKADCEADSYELDPDHHRYCCRSHESSEAEWSDILADRRARGEMNPQTWPPIIDEDQFDIPDGAPTATTAETGGAEAPPAHLTIDDLD